MKIWIKIIAAAIPTTAALLLLSFLLTRCRRHRLRQRQPVVPQFSEPIAPQFSETAAKSRFDGLHASINKLHISYKSGSSARNSLRFHHLHHNHHHPAQPEASAPFSWDEHPRLIIEAVEAGWPRFAFSAVDPRPPSAPLWALCPACNGGAQREAAEGAWEVPAGSSEFMQTVRLNSGPMKPAPAEEPPFSCVRLSLPLPGPALSSGAAFPQEAYFEITILCLQPWKQLPATASKRTKGRESDRAKLIRENSIGAAAADSPPQQSASAAEEKRSGELAVTLGLTAGRDSPSSQAMPGTYPGSIGFHSDGSVYFDGRKLVFGSEKAGWGGVNRVIGCGFEPRKKKVFFTVDSKLAHVIRCSSEAYSSPLYPVLAAGNSADAMLLVNLGQAPFKYAPSNAVRTPNPCFLRPLPPGDAGGDEAGCDVDSRELFSVARLESERVERGRRSRHNHHQNNSSSSKKSRGVSGDDAMDYDDAESDLFEISLQS